MNEISLENLKLFAMYLENKKVNYKHDFKKSAIQNLAEYVLIGLTLDKVNYTIEVYEDRY